MRAQISFSTIIELVIALMVLLLVGTFFSGGFKGISEKYLTFGRESTGSNATETGQAVGCNAACAGWIGEVCPDTGSTFTKTKEKCGLASTATKPDLEGKCGKC